MTLTDLVRSLPEQVREWLAAVPEPAGDEIAGLQRTVATAAEVVAVLASPGGQAILAEEDAQERLLLEGFVVTAEDVTAARDAGRDPAGTPIQTFEQFVEYRGFVRGWRARRRLGAAIVQAGARAELRLEELTKKRRSKGSG